MHTGSSVSATSEHLFKAIFYLRVYFMVWRNVLENGQIVQLFVWWWSFKPAQSPLHPVADTSVRWNDTTNLSSATTLSPAWVLQASDDMTLQPSHRANCFFRKTPQCLFMWISGGMVANQSQPVLWLLAFCLTAWTKCKRWVCGCGFTSGSLWVCWGPSVSWCFPLIEDTTVLLMGSLWKHRVTMVTHTDFNIKVLCKELGTWA